MRTLADIDWDRWTPTMRATLLFVLRDGHALLIRKKRGLGAGLINAPGGRIEPGETALEAALREVEEEVGVRPRGAQARGELSFQFTDGLALHVHVYTAPDCEGEVIETDEALPLWLPVDALPYDEMWADDRIWVPVMLRGERFTLRAVFDGQELLDHTIEHTIEHAAAED